ncbi:MAG: rane protein, partial [Marmoricola sp.]|nr:rane protein [Marmoricola sp.]
MSKTESLVRVGIAYVVAFGAGALWFAYGLATPHLWLDGLIADLIATVVVFIASRLHKNSSFYDAYWSVLPPLLMLAWWIEAGRPTCGRIWLVAFVIAFWAVRLTGNWIYAWPGMHHEDWRYPMLKERAGRADPLVDLMGIHVFPTLQVFAGMLPVYVVVTRTSRGLGWLDIVALVVGVGAVVLEFFA